MGVGIAGIGRTEYSRNSGRTTLAMAAEACRAAVDDAGVDLADVDGMICFEAGDSVGPLAVSSAIGIPELAWNIDTMGGGNVVANVIATAGAVIDAGLCRSVLVYRSLNGRSGHRFGTADRPARRWAASFSSRRPTVTSCRRSGSRCGPGVTSTSTARRVTTWARSPSSNAPTRYRTRTRSTARRSPSTTTWPAAG